MFSINNKLSYRTTLGIQMLLAIGLTIPTWLYAEESNSLAEKIAAQDPPPVSLPIMVLEPPADIPDNNTVTIYGKKIAGPSTVNGNLTVEVVLDHTWVGDLVIKLRSPLGTEVTLLDRPGSPPGFGCSNDNMNVLFDDTASLNPETHCAGTDPWLTGSVLPAQPLTAAFNGQLTAGTWSLIVSDNAGGDTGRVLSWNIFVNGVSLDATIGDFQVAALGNGSVQANWTTLREENHGGFNLYRVCSASGVLKDVAHLYNQNPYGPLVQAGVELQADGMRHYSYQDTPPAGVGICHYTLENVDLAGHMSPYKEGEGVAIRSVNLNN